MIHRLGRHVAKNLVAYLALAVAVVGSGGSYAVAATHRSSKKRPTTIAACVNDRTGELTLKRSKRCSRGHREVSWNIKGPKGATGAAGAPAPSIYAAVEVSDVAAGIQPIPEKGLAVQRTGLGTYTVTITDSVCSKGQNVPTLTPTLGFLSTEAAPPPDAAPIAYIADENSPAQFVVQTGYSVNGSFSPEDLNFDVEDTCMPPSTDRAAR